MSTPIQFPDKLPVLETQRLRLRAFASTDAKRVQLLAGDARVAATTALIPHPYLDGLAESWISSHKNAFREGAVMVWAIDWKAEARSAAGDLLVGCISFSFSQVNRRAELGYWIGVEYWNKGIGTEAAAACAKCAFSLPGFNKITSCHMAENPASGRIMQKIGMVQEGYFPQHLWKNGRLVDMVYYGLTRERFLALNAKG